MAKRKRVRAAPKPKTKVVVRRLPASLTEEEAQALVEPFKEDYGEYGFSRFVLNFKTPESVYNFSQAFSHQIFKDPRGVDYKAVVEYAPSQAVPRKKTHSLAKMGTIEKDSDYIKFLEILAQKGKPAPENGVEGGDGTGPATAEASDVEPASSTPKLTPLLEFLRAKQQDKVMAAEMAALEREKKRKRAIEQEREREREREKEGGKGSSGRNRDREKASSSRGSKDKKGHGAERGFAKATDTAGPSERGNRTGERKALSTTPSTRGETPTRSERSDRPEKSQRKDSGEKEERSRASRSSDKRHGSTSSSKPAAEPVVRILLRKPDPSASQSGATESPKQANDKTKEKSRPSGETASRSSDARSHARSAPRAQATDRSVSRWSSETSTDEKTKAKKEDAKKKDK
eukprot:Ihof_evm2s82 gene=Ihof_evmTU2s82